MRLYPKKLRSIEDLEMEKKLLIKERRRLDNEEFLSLDGLFGKKNKGGKEENDSGSLFDFLPVSNPLVDILLKLVQQRFSKKDNKRESAEKQSNKESRGNPLKGVAVEFIGGYLKWKAIELSYKGIKYLFKTRKEKRGQRQ